MCYKRLLLYFYGSGTYKGFLKINSAFKNIFLKNTNRSQIINSVKTVIGNITPKDIGLFVFLVVLFNTLAMFALGKEIDIFSGIARTFFFCLGILLMLKK